MDPDFLNVLSGLGVGGILAALFYYQNNKNALDYAKRTDELSRMYLDKIESMCNIEKGRTEMLVTLVRDNTSQTTSNTEVLRALHRRIDKEEMERIERNEKEK